MKLLTAGQIIHQTSINWWKSISPSLQAHFPHLIVFLVFLLCISLKIWSLCYLYVDRLVSFLLINYRSFKEYHEGNCGRFGWVTRHIWGWNSRRSVLGIPDYRVSCFHRHQHGGHSGLWHRMVMNYNGFFFFIFWIQCRISLLGLCRIVCNTVLFLFFSYILSKQTQWSPHRLW